MHFAQFAVSSYLFRATRISHAAGLSAYQQSAQSIPSANRTEMASPMPTARQQQDLPAESAHIPPSAAFLVDSPELYSVLAGLISNGVFFSTGMPAAPDVQGMV